MVELMEYGHTIREHGLRIEVSLGKGIELEQEPVGRGFGERSKKFRHCRQEN